MATTAFVAGTAAITAAAPASAAPCEFEPQGEGRVTEVIDARSIRLEDGREIRLAGIEPAFPEKPGTERMRVLTSLLTGRTVRLHGDDDTPDRYGRQIAFAWRLPDETLVQ